jgi:hypothetical protein
MSDEAVEYIEAGFEADFRVLLSKILRRSWVALTGVIE